MKNFLDLVKCVLAVALLALVVWLVDGTGAMEAFAASPHRFIAPIEPIQERADFAEWIPVGTVEELDAIRHNLSGRFFLTADIDLAGIEWMPIGDNAMPFSGMFDGQGHIIRNLTITQEILGIENDNTFNQFYGLFGNAVARNSAIINLGLENVNISVELSLLTEEGQGGHAQLSMGGIAGRAQRIENTFVTGQIQLNGSAGVLPNQMFYSVGGIVGVIESRINASYNTAIIDVELIISANFDADLSRHAGHVARNLNVGGIAGSILGGGIVLSSFNTGDVFGMLGGMNSPTVHVGGVLGNAGTGGVQDSFNIGDVEAVSIALDSRSLSLVRQSALWTSAVAFASGVSNGPVRNSYNRGNVNSTASGNGANNGSSRARSGGISTWTPANVANSVNLGSVESNHHGFAIAIPPNMQLSELSPHLTGSRTFGGIIQNTFVRSNYSGIRYGNTIFMPDSAFATQAFWEERVGFDFENIWEMSPHGYPVFIGMSDIAVRGGDGLPEPRDPARPVYRFPLDNHVVSYLGDFGIPRAIENWAFHNGVDMTGSSNEVFAVADGYIIMIRNGDRRHIPGERNYNVGYTIIARHYGFWAEYSHLVPHSIFLDAAGNPGPNIDSPVLQVPITAGQSLGWLSHNNSPDEPGYTPGYPFGTHLHFGIRDASLNRWEESRNWWDGSSGGRYLTREALDNQGFVDPLPFIYNRINQ